MQQGQDLGEEMRREGIIPQRKGVYHQCPEIWCWRHKDRVLGVPPGGKEIHMGRALKKQESCDFLVKKPLCGESVVLAGRQVGNDIYLPRNVDCLQGDLQINDQLEKEFCILPAGQGAHPFSLFMKETTVELSEDT